jgi:hypothetical protein
VVYDIVLPTCFFSLHGVSKISHGKKFQNGLTQGFLAGLDQSRLREPDNFFERCIVFNPPLFGGKFLTPPQ